MSEQQFGIAMLHRPYKKVAATENNNNKKETSIKK